MCGKSGLESLAHLLSRWWVGPLEWYTVRFDPVGLSMQSLYSFGAHNQMVSFSTILSNGSAKNAALLKMIETSIAQYTPVTPNSNQRHPNNPKRRLKRSLRILNRRPHPITR
jgi:hypothetical protein